MLQVASHSLPLDGGGLGWGWFPLPDKTETTR
jgi:hypothetical protein